MQEALICASHTHPLTHFFLEIGLFLPLLQS